MSDNPRNAIDSLRIHVAELMERYSSLSRENLSLKNQLREKECAMAALQKDLEEIHAKYKNLAMAQAVASQEGDLVAARSRFDKLVREIDKCISLLDE